MLKSKLGDAIEITRYLSFATRLCKGVLLYQSAPGARAMVRKELKGVMTRRHRNSSELSSSSTTPRPSVPESTSQPVPRPSLPRSSVSFSTSQLVPGPSASLGSSVSLSTPQPVAEFALADFELNCFPPRLSLKTTSCKIRAGQLFVNGSGASLQLSDFRFEPLRNRLQARNVLSDLNHQCLMYDTPAGVIGVIDDDDLRNAVHFAPANGRNSIKITVRT